MSTDTLLALVVAGLFAVLVLQIASILLRQRSSGDSRLEQLLRQEIAESLRLGRSELGEGLVRLQQNVGGQMSDIAKVQNERLKELRDAAQADARTNREESAATLKRFADGMHQQLNAMIEANDRRFADVRTTLETKLKDLQTDNAAKLEEMRRTVDEKLHHTLETRLGQSFKLVSDRLDAVHKGLGEMQNLAIGVGDLKKVLTNVKTRGTWGEVQLQSLLEQILTDDQYAKNFAPKPGSQERVEFAIRMPGRGDGEPLWLPIDAKFPREDYERLVDAQERADTAAMETAGKDLDSRIRLEAKNICEKYIAPPHTTDFAVLFLPTEGLYAEVLRRAGLWDSLQRDYRVTVAGPTTLWAILNSLQMGFRTLAIQKRSGEVWQLLGAVKTEFGKFGDILAKTKDQLDKVSDSISAAETRTRQITKKLRDVEQLPEGETRAMLSNLPDPDNAA